MDNASVYTPEEIRRRTEEFEAANRREHTRLILGVILMTLLIAGGAFLALADF